MTRPRSFPCPWGTCQKVFNRKSDLCRHHRIHTNDRPYHCEFPNCTKSFIQRSALTVHSRTHTGEKPHVCDFANCKKAFSDSSSLARHRRIHTGKRPYKCTEPTCERSFCRKTTLTKHQHRSHQLELSPQTPSLPHHSPPDLYPQQSHQQQQQQQSSLQLPPPQPQPPIVLPQTPQSIPEQPSTYQRPLITAAEFYSPQTQPIVHSIPDTPVLEPEVHYVNAGMVIPQPQIQRFDIPPHMDPLSRFQQIPPAPLQHLPFHSIPPISYPGSFPLDKFEPRIIGETYHEPKTFDYLGLEG